MAFKIVMGFLSDREMILRYKGTIHMKYVDDMTQAQSINLLECLIPNPDLNPPRPFQHHDHYLLQDQLDNLVEYCRIYQMKINENKSKVMLFKTRRKYDGRPRLTIQGGDAQLEVVDIFKLLVVMVRSNLK